MNLHSNRKRMGRARHIRVAALLPIVSYMHKPLSKSLTLPFSTRCLPFPSKSAIETYLGLHHGKPNCQRFPACLSKIAVPQGVHQNYHPPHQSLTQISTPNSLTQLPYLNQEHHRLKPGACRVLAI